MNNIDRLIIIGAGPAGLAAAGEAVKSGLNPDRITVLERDSTPGGILNQCIHAGFGLHTFGEELTGPEYAGRYIREVERLGINITLNAMALSMTAVEGGGAEVAYVSPTTGFIRERGAVIIATGCRERTRGAIGIPGTRPSGIFTAGGAQRFVNLEDKMPGHKIVILGSGDIGLIMARRLTLEGAKVLRVCELQPYSSGLGRNIAQCLNDFDIPLCLSQTVTEIHGNDRVEGITVSAVDENLRPIKGSEEYIECDTLLLSVGLIPENELAKACGIELDRVTGGAVVNQNRETSISGVFACGNALQVHDLVDFASAEAVCAGAAAAKYILDGCRSSSGGICRTVPGARVRYIVPQILDKDAVAPETKLKLFFRVDNIYRDVILSVKADGKLLKTVKKRIVTPGEMENITLDSKLCEAVRISETLEISITDAE